MDSAALMPIDPSLVGRRVQAGTHRRRQRVVRIAPVCLKHGSILFSFDRRMPSIGVTCHSKTPGDAVAARSALLRSPH
jgi:hypothetical protein